MWPGWASQARARTLKADQIHIEPLGRFGYTGARLFKAHFDKNRVGAPYVLKIDTVKNVNSEALAQTKAAAFYPNTYPQQVDSPSGGELSLLMYNMIVDSSGDITELREQYEKVGDPSDFLDSLDKMYALCKNAHSPEGIRTTFDAAYDKYLRNSRPDKLAESLGTSEIKLEFFGGNYWNPTNIVKTIGQKEGTLAKGFIHGDLHPNNVVINQHNKPSLIDFAWAGEGDILIDFVLMECSLRFLLFPHNIDWPAHRRVAQMLVTEDGPAEIIQFYKENPNTVHQERYLRMAQAIQIVRSRAKDHAKSYWDFDNYLCGQFMMLYGLSKIEAYPFAVTVDALGIIGTKLLGEPS